MLKQNAYFRVINDTNEPACELTKSGALRLIVWHTSKPVIAGCQPAKLKQVNSFDFGSIQLENNLGVR
jgi:hypothetical protein